VNGSHFLPLCCIRSCFHCPCCRCCQLAAAGVEDLSVRPSSGCSSPVVHDEKFRIVLLLSLVKKWTTALVDVETAFVLN
jgi:hypothetical protein